MSIVVVATAADDNDPYQQQQEQQLLKFLNLSLQINDFVLIIPCFT
jgi:hypothetical protein